MFLAAALAALSSTAARAANTASWAAGSPTTATGQVTGQGTYTADTGWAPLTGTLIVIPAVGGMASTATIPMPTGGTWGPTTVKGLATGQYSVQALIVFKQAGQYTTQSVYSPFAVVNVP